MLSKIFNRKGRKEIFSSVIPKGSLLLSMQLIQATAKMPAA
jgi:hypothetical protein